MPAVLSTSGSTHSSGCLGGRPRHRRRPDARPVVASRSARHRQGHHPIPRRHLWPAMLMAAGLPLPRRIFGHGFMTKDGQRMSKSNPGTIIDPAEAAARLALIRCACSSPKRSCSAVTETSAGSDSTSGTTSTLPITWATWSSRLVVNDRALPPGADQRAGALDPLADVVRDAVEHTGWRWRRSRSTGRARRPSRSWMPPTDTSRPRRRGASPSKATRPRSMGTLDGNRGPAGRGGPAEPGHAWLVRTDPRAALARPRSTSRTCVLRATPSCTITASVK